MFAWLAGLKVYLNPKTTYLFKDSYKETLIRNPKKGKFLRVQVGLKMTGPRKEFKLSNIDQYIRATSLKFSL